MSEERLAALEARLDEVERRLAEAGRRALFHAESGTVADIELALRETLAEVGRALLFDPETPDPAAR